MTEIVKYQVPLAGAVSAFRTGVILATLKACHGNQCEAARRLGMHRNTIARDLRKATEIYGVRRMLKELMASGAMPKRRALAAVRM